MTRDDCKRILENIEVIRHFSEGGDVESCLHDYKGAFVKWMPARTLLIACLGRYRITKPHLRIQDGAPVVMPRSSRPCKATH